MLAKRRMLTDLMCAVFSHPKLHEVCTPCCMKMLSENCFERRRNRILKKRFKQNLTHAVKQTLAYRRTDLFAATQSSWQVPRDQRARSAQTNPSRTATLDAQPPLPLPCALASSTISIGIASKAKSRANDHCSRRIECQCQKGYA